MSMNFGVAIDFAPNPGTGYQVRLQQLTPLLETVSTAGYRALSAGESYVFDTRDPLGFHSPNALMMLAAVADRVPSSRLVAGVSLLAGWNALRLAYDSCLVDQLSGGRLTLGLGLGSPDAWRAFGLSPDQLGTRLRTTVDLLRSAWNGAVPTDGGALDFVPLPAQPSGPPILIGGARRVSALRAAELADGFVASSGYSLDLVKRQAARYAEALGGRPGLVSVNRFAVVAETERKAQDLYRDHVAPLVAAYRASGLVGPQAAPPRDGSDLCLIGTPGRVTELVAGYREAGVDEIHLRVAAGGIPVPAAVTSLELFASEVCPAMRSDMGELA